MNIGRAFSVRRFLSSWKEPCVLWCLDEAFFDSCLVCVLYGVEQWCVSSPLWVWFLVHRFLTTARNWRVKFFLCWHNVIPYCLLSLILSHSVMFLFCITVMLIVGSSHSVMLNVWFCLSHIKCLWVCLAQSCWMSLVLSQSCWMSLVLFYSVMFWFSLTRSYWMFLGLPHPVMLSVLGSVSVMLNVPASVILCHVLMLIVSRSVSLCHVLILSHSVMLNVSGSVPLGHVECPWFCLSHVECLVLSLSCSDVDCLWFCLVRSSWTSLLLSRGRG